MTLRISAPAKVNLSLQITGKRGDGYHLLDSLVAFTAFGDELEFSESDDLSLTIKGDFAQPLVQEHTTNIVLKAARLLKEKTRAAKGAHITLHKYIPVGAGLGGGSADAAAALRGLCRFWGVEIANDQLTDMALELGSDVPVCVHSRMARMRGVGEIITRIPLKPEVWIVLVNPKQPLLTKAVFSSYSGDFSAEGKAYKQIDSLNALLSALEGTHNALQQPAIGLLPVIQNILDVINNTKGCHMARMSGSGATCFGLYASKEVAQAASERIQQAQPGWWTTCSYLLYES